MKVTAADAVLASSKSHKGSEEAEDKVGEVARGQGV